MNENGKILIIDDSKFCLTIASDLLKQEGFEVIEVKSGFDGLEIAIKEQPDLILLDLIMPKIDGLETARQFKVNKEVKDIPIMFLTAGDIKTFISDAYESGAVDYIMKPFNRDELLARVKTQIELRRRTIDLEKLNKMIIRKNKELNELLITDSLTKLCTRDYILERIEEEQMLFIEDGKNFSLIMLDIDYFKDINDKYGHHCGDFILTEISNHFKTILREKDTIARWGGEEFLILLPNTKKDYAYFITNHILESIRKKSFIYEENEISVTISFGIASCKLNESIESIIKIADEKLYQAKLNGRNQICC